MSPNLLSLNPSEITFYAPCRNSSNKLWTETIAKNKKINVYIFKCATVYSKVKMFFQREISPQAQNFKQNHLKLYDLNLADEIVE